MHIAHPQLHKHNYLNVSNYNREIEEALIPGVYLCFNRCLLTRWSSYCFVFPCRNTLANSQQDYKLNFQYERKSVTKSFGVFIYGKLILITIYSIRPDFCNKKRTPHRELVYPSSETGLKVLLQVFGEYNLYHRYFGFYRKMNVSIHYVLIDMMYFLPVMLSRT